MESVQTFGRKVILAHNSKAKIALIHPGGYEWASLSGDQRQREGCWRGSSERAGLNGARFQGQPWETASGTFSRVLHLTKRAEREQSDRLDCDCRRRATEKSSWRAESIPLEAQSMDAMTSGGDTAVLCPRGSCVVSLEALSLLGGHERSIELKMGVSIPADARDDSILPFPSPLSSKKKGISSFVFFLSA